MPATREIGPFMQRLRALLLGRNHMNNLRRQGASQSPTCHLDLRTILHPTTTTPGMAGGRWPLHLCLLMETMRSQVVRRVHQWPPGLEGHQEEFTTSRTLRVETSDCFLRI